MIINSINDNLNNEFFLIAKQFFPYETFDNLNRDNIEKKNNNFYVEHNEVLNKKYATEYIKIKKDKKIKAFEYKYEFGSLGLSREKESSRFAKMAFYEALKKFTKKKLDWGCLTGVHPTKIAYEFLSHTDSLNEVKQKLIKLYDLNEDKALLLCNIISSQKNVGCFPLKQDKINSAIFYINIPFCTSKCSYCSFISAVIGKCKQLVEPYVDALCEEIKATKKLIEENNIKIKCVYMGGGTPTSLTSAQLDKILSLCDFGNIEFTVEAGRPDTITKEKLQVLKKHKVSRISINPQTFNDKVLKEIGRSHSVQDVYEKFDLAKKMNFKINMDLIAGLPLDTYNSFKKSVKNAIALQPDNITIHTLALKTKASLIKQNFARNNRAIKKMIAFSNKTLRKYGYMPYYTYRQKNMLENQENVGWSQANKLCKYNIYSMEDFENVIACGANSISKRIYPSTNRIERCDCPKDIKTYVEKIDKLIEKKKIFFSD